MILEVSFVVTWSTNGIGIIFHSRRLVNQNINVQVAENIPLLFWSKTGNFLINYADKIINVTVWMVINNAYL